MARQILYLHWKAIRLGLLPLVIAAFGLPLMAIQGLGRSPTLGDGFYAQLILEVMGGRLLFFPMLAAIIGVTLALTSWTWDHETKHVYALSLPLPRWRYAVLKFGAGALLALIPAIALFVGVVAASASLTLPPLLHAYPVAIATRFFLATLLIYALVFAFAAGSIRTTVILLTVWVTVLIAGDFALDFAANLLGRPELASVSFTTWLWELMTMWPGPFSILSGNWAFIDV